MNSQSNRKLVLIRQIALGAATVALAPAVLADEGGVSFWLPGQMGSFSAVPTEPGWSSPLAYYHTSTEAKGEKVFQLGGQFVTGLDANADLLFAFPTYTFATPFAGGGQAAVALGAAAGRAEVKVNGTLTGPNSGVLTSGNTSDSVKGVADLYPMGTVKWHNGVNNYLAYTSVGIPVGTYKEGRLANIGTNHWSVDAGGGYTYLDATGLEFSAVGGLTYNFENDDTHYQNGVSSHLDWAASQTFSGQWQVGLVGYFYYQLSGDSGSGARLGDFKSTVSAVGPQAGYFFKVGDRKWYANVKGYYEFDSSNRAKGWNAWFALNIPL